ncbi:sugar nucleotide-binding protein [Virgibacillus halodenitrificans]|jgi:dTDP-4-dehydrorhamnose reductase|uniref:sugar nucleotide-binding protein n=1 Tax=Virgibacillus halodenitrificans TaxID=1482 RepID=UPI001F468C8C|nr:sugar nucleotide-binding protein [Virgibacillus halodenitrificans]MCJ0932822.1 sugar nucleotide-binding protein [Virgibacillus halodenitrificans]
MKVCVFGANGYVGSSVYKVLKDISGIEVSGTFLEEPSMFDDLVKLDVNEPESFSEYFKEEQPDVVVWSVMAGPNEHELTDQGLIHLITHLTPETKLIYLSSDFVYSAGNGPYKEEDPLSTLPEDHTFSNYTNAKVKAERLIDKELTNYAILRAGPIYGENEIGKLDERTDKLAYHLRADKPIAFRDDLIRSFVHVADLASVIVEFVQNDLIGVYNTGPEKTQSFYEFMREEAEKLGYDADLVEKGSEEERVDEEIPKNTSLNTEKIKGKLKLNFR